MWLRHECVWIIWENFKFSLLYEFINEDVKSHIYTVMNGTDFSRYIMEQYYSNKGEQ